MDVEEQERIDSVNRDIRADKPVNICRDVGRSKTWLFTWVSRFENGKEEWYKSQSRAPKKHVRKTGTEIESTIVNIRKALMAGNECSPFIVGVFISFIFNFYHQCNIKKMSEESKKNEDASGRTMIRNGDQKNGEQEYKCN